MNDNASQNDQHAAATGDSSLTNHLDEELASLRSELDALMSEGDLADELAALQSSPSNESPVSLAPPEGKSGMSITTIKAPGRWDNEPVAIAPAQANPPRSQGPEHLSSETPPWRKWLLWLGCFAAINLFLVLGIRHFFKKSDSSKSTLNFDQPVGVNTADPQSVIRAFITAESPERQLPLIRSGKHLAQSVRYWTTLHPWKPLGTDAVVKSVEPYTQSGMNLVRADVVLLPSNQKVQYILQKDARDFYKIDWETAVRYEEMSWTAFVSTRPVSEKVFRLLASISDDFSAPFASHEHFAAYTLTHPSNDRSVTGYVARDSATAAALEAAVKQHPDTPCEWTLALTFHAGTASGEFVLITKLLADGWVIPYDSARPEP